MDVANLKKYSYIFKKVLYQSLTTSVRDRSSLKDSISGLQFNLTFMRSATCAEKKIFQNKLIRGRSEKIRSS